MVPNVVTRPIISSNPIPYVGMDHSLPIQPSATPAEQENRILTVSQSFFSDWWSINDVIGSQFYCFQGMGL